MWLNVSSGSSGSRDESQEVQTNGIIKQEYLSTSHSFLREKDKVDSKKGSPLMRYKHAVCSSQAGHIYLHGGRYGNKPLDDDLWKFDPHENTWHQLETSGFRPPSLQEHTLVEFDNYLYLFGGQVSAGDSEIFFWQMDLDNHQWRLLNQRSSRRGAHLEPTNRRGHSAVVRDNCMYIFGGFEDFRGSSNQLWEFNFITQLWQLRDLNASSSSRPGPRHGHSAIVYGDSMYIYGGLSNLKPLNDLWRWSWTAKRWFREKTRGRSPGYLHGHTAIQAFGSMFIFGGERKSLTTRALWRLNLSNMCWHKIKSREPQPSPTTWHGAVVNPLNKLDEMNYIVDSATQSAERVRSEDLNQQTYQSKDSSFISPGQPLNSISIGNIKSLLELQSNWRKKRGSRLTFLKRFRRRTMDSNHSRSKSMIDNIPLNSCNNNIDSSNTSNEHSDTSAKQLIDSQPSKSDSKTINSMIEREYNNVDVDQHPVSSILDNLNEDIEQMFENHSVEPENQFSEILDSQSSKMMSNIHSNDITTSNEKYVTVRQSTSVALDVTSQRTSCSYVTPMSEMSATSNIAGQSRAVTSSNRVERHAKALASVRNKSTRQNDRPKSEIVQSLIDRADSSIKHMYTPFFKRTDPKRLSLTDTTKRHTIPQTMTYYNLYFEEELDELSMIPSEHHLSSSTIKASTSTQYSGIGALDGIHSNPIDENDSQKSNPPNHTNLSLISTHHNSRTPVAQDITPEASGSSVRNNESITCVLTVRRDTADEGADNTSLSFSAIAEFEEDDMLQYASPVPEEKPQETIVELRPEVEPSYLNPKQERDPTHKTRYWQLCMFVIGGKQTGAVGRNEPINVWRLYI